ncbi:MAG TPA: hypothetical protein VJ817_14100 [Gemmatimonadales bacterium]|nr:hypothetical protein [Gemmatimonadales bacterium]
MTRPLRGLLLLLAVFAAGVGTGVGLDRAIATGSKLETRLNTAMPAVLDRLGLTPEQRRAVDSLLDWSRPRAQAAMAELVPRLGAIADSLDAELRQILTPAQRARLDSLGGRGLLVLKRKTSGPGGLKVDTLLRR